jgi:LytS/YehU family sensor histidine kinase
VSFILLLFGLGTNLGVKLYVRSLSARQRLDELEKENAEQHLEHLKYQLHPHFFMNTLNNIHALVDINPKKAQECIIDLSKLMRYILYESNHEYVQASREVEFMANYVRLMSIRYNDKLKFTADNSDDGTGIWIPPLVFISFVENAFKHGVSYNKKSYINVGATRYTSDSGKMRLLYTCRNSKQSKPKSDGKKVSEASGVGLTNIKSRLDLMFGDNYRLDITDGADEFVVKMDIPVFTKDPSLASEEKISKPQKETK